jgi:CRISPR-associated protein Cas5t
VEPLALYVSVPVASFRVPQAREYLETLPCPPPSTVYGMLLSLVGEPDRVRHAGVEVALALLGTPERSVVLRTVWHVKTRRAGPGIGANRRPDFQELLTGLQLAVWIRAGVRETATPRLAERVRAAIVRPEGTTRFGGLSLGESTHLVDEVRPLRSSDPDSGQLLVNDPEGDLALPVWPDHVGSARTRWGQYRLVRARVVTMPGERAWTGILPSGVAA